MLWLRSLLFAIGQVASTLVWAPLSLATYPLPFRQRYAFLALWARFNLWWLAVTCGLRFQVSGGEHLPDGPAIVMAKHQSAWETLALQLIFPPQTWVLKRELLRIPLFGWALALLEPIAIDRSAGRQAIAQIIDQGRARLAAGRWVVIFPEGTRVAPGQKGRYGIGGAALAEASGYPVVPVAHNAGHYWRRAAFLKRPGTIRVVVGPVIETRERSATEILRQVESWIESVMPSITPADFAVRNEIA